jgi:hypothetical protein
VALALGEIAERLSWIKLGSREKFSGLRATPAALAAQQLPNRPARIALPRGLARGALDSLPQPDPGSGDDAADEVSAILRFVVLIARWPR